MTAYTRLRRAAIGFAIFACAPAIALAQPGAFGDGYGPPLKVVPPPKEFATSKRALRVFAQAGARRHEAHAHIGAALGRALGNGRQYAHGRVHRRARLQGQGQGRRADAGVREAAYKERWRQQQEDGQVQYDRLTDCEPAGYPRILLEPYSDEFINLPNESYFMNDFANRCGGSISANSTQSNRHALVARRHGRVLGRR